MKKNKLSIILFSLFLILLGLTIYTGIGVMAEEPEVILKKTTLVYDENSGIEIENGNMTFNDKNQKVIYKLTLENTQDYDIKVSDINLSSPTEEFLKFQTVEDIDKIEANSTKEISLSLETTGIKGWGRNFKDNLIADISFEKWEEQEKPLPQVKEEEKEETPKEETPKEEISKEEIPKEDETTKEEVESGDSNSEQEVPNGEESSDKENENIVEEEIENEVPNPNTSDKNMVIVLAVATAGTGILTIIVSGKKIQKYAVSILVVALGTTLTTVYANKLISIPLTINVSFESQNVMSAAYLTNSSNQNVFMDFWQYSGKIKNIYIQNEKTKIDSPRYSFDVTVDKNQRVKAYLVTNSKDSNYYDLYLQADGIIYLNEDASYYFYNMKKLDGIHNIAGIDTSKVTNMSSMFSYTGYESPNFTLDVSNFDTSNVTNMNSMFYKTGYNSTIFALDLVNFDTSKVTNMSSMFSGTGKISTRLNTSITIKNQNTTYSGMFDDRVATQSGSHIKVNYTSKTGSLVDKMIATKTAGANVVKGDLVEIITDNIAVGDEIAIGAEHFNVISQTDDTITMLAQYNLGTDYKQSTTPNLVSFSDNNGWKYAVGPKEIDIQTWSTNPKTYISSYVNYLKEELGGAAVTGDLITLKDLEALGCTIPSDYAWGSGGWNCYDSSYGWITNGQTWWTRSASSTGSYNIWSLFTDGSLRSYNILDYSRSIRPVITVSKETINKLNS